MKKIISLILALITIFSLTTPCFALEGQKASIEEAVALAEELYPGAEIFVDENEIIHILPAAMSSMYAVQTSQIYAPEGGRFHSFIRPPLTDMYAPAPLSIVYLPHEQVDAIDIAKDNKELFYHVIDLLGAGTAVEKIIESVLKTFKIRISSGMVFFYSVIKFYDIIDTIDRYMFNSAREKYNKICIQQLNLRGNISNVYLEWSGSYVSPSPYDNWNPSFRPGDYSVF